MNYKIVRGPSKFELMTALFAGQEITFRTQILTDTTSDEAVVIPAGRPSRNPLVKAIVNSVQQEDGSLESWNIEGHIPSEKKEFKAYYHTGRQSGHIEF